MEKERKNREKKVSVKQKDGAIGKKQAVILLLCIGVILSALAVVLINRDEKSSGQEVLKGYKKEYPVNQELLEKEEKASFDFLWDHTNQDKNSAGYGLVMDRAANEKMTSVASVGFALTGYGIGVENGWITKEEGEERAIGTLRTLYHNAEQVEGFFYHFLDKETARRYEKVEVSMIDTAIAVNGALFAGEYFGGEAKELANQIYERVNWDWYRNPKTNRFYMEYLPEKGEHTGTWSVYAEQLMAYFLGAASPTHPVPADMLYQIDRTRTSWAGMPPYISSPANSIFTYQFSQAWFDLENQIDNEGYDWYHNSVVATLASRQYSIDTRNIFKTFNENAWGLTACDGPFGYSGHYGANPENPVDGTIPPCGSAGSAPYAPNLVSDSLEYQKGIEGLYDEKWGFKDAFNQEGDGTIVIEDYLSIDKGITMVMIENQKSRLVWDTMNQNQYVIEGKKLAGLSDADTRLVEDGDTVSNHKGIQEKNLKIETDGKKSQGRSGLKVQFAKGKENGTLSMELKNIRLDENNAASVQMDVLGKADIHAIAYDDSGNVLCKTDRKELDSSEYETVQLPLKGSAEYYEEIAKIELVLEKQEDTIYLDEIGFAAVKGQVRNVTISEHPYVDGELYVYFDYLGTDEEEPLFAYQWKSADSMKGELTDIKGADKPNYTPTMDMVERYLQVEVTPVDKNGNIIGTKSISTAVSKVSKEMPVVAEYIEEIIKKSRGSVPDVVSKDTFSVLEYWIDGGQQVYQIGGADEKLLVKFKKENMEYPYMVREITANDLSKFNKLAFQVKSDSKLLIKLEQKDAAVIGEVEIEPGKDGSYYEWDLEQHKEMLKNMGRILIFALPGEPSGEGAFEFGKLEFSVEKATENVIYSKGQTPSPTNYYQGQTSTFDFNHYWVDGGDKVYTIAEEPIGFNTIGYKKNNSPEWANANTKINGRLQEFKKIVFEVKGAKGEQVLFKAEGSSGSAESGIVTLKEGWNTVEINLAELTDRQKNSLSQVLLFVCPAQKNGSGKVELSSAYFSKEGYSGTGVIHTYNGNKEDFSFNSSWYDSGDGVYDITSHDGKTEVNYRKENAQEYAYMESLVKGLFSDFKYANFRIKGTPGQTLILKLEGEGYNQEYKHIFSGDYDTVSVVLDEKQNRNGIAKAIIMALPGETNGQGSFALEQAYFSNKKLSQTPDPVVHTYDGNKKDFIIRNGFEDTKDRVYEIASAKDCTKVAYRKNKGNEWSSLQALVNGRFSDFKYLYVDVKGEIGKELLVKLEAQGFIKEELIHFSGKRQKIGVRIDHHPGLDNLQSILMFASPGKLENGQFEIYSLTFSNTEPPKEPVHTYQGNKEDFHFNSQWQDNGDNAHRITEKKGQVHVDVVKEKGQEYSYMYTNIQGDFSDFNKLYVVVKGEARKQVLLKLEGGSYKKEEWLTLSGNMDYFEINLEGGVRLDELEKVLLFGNGGTVEDTSFDLYDIYFTHKMAEPEIDYNKYPGDSKDFSINSKYISNAAGVHDFRYRGSKVQVKAEKKKGQEWEYFYSPVKGRFSDFKYLNLTIKGNAGEQILLKIENPKNPAVGSKELPITLTGSEQKVQWDLTDVNYLSKLNKVMVFLAPGEMKSSAVTISELKFTNKKQAIKYTGNEYSGDKKDFSVNQKYISNDPGKYTFEYHSGKVKAAVTKQPGDEWIYFYSPIKGTFSDFKYLNLTVKGSAGQKLVVKVQNPSDNTKNNELSVDLDGKEQNIQWDISDVTYRDSLDKIMIFMTPGTTDSGSVEIAELKFTNTHETQPYTGNEYSGDKQDFSVNQKYVSNDPNKYTFEYQSGKVKAAVTKQPGDEWIYFYSPIKGKLSDFKYLNLTVKGSAGQQLVVKVQNPSDNTKNKELSVDLDGKEQNIQWDISDVTYRDSLDKIMIFMTPGTTDSGSVEITELKFTNTQKTQPYTGNEYSGDKQDFSVNQKYVSNDPNKYTFEYQNGKAKASVTKQPGDEWIYFYSPIKGKLSDFKYLNLTVKGSAGQQLMVKVQNPSDNTKNKELSVDLDGKEQNIQWDISDVTYRDSLDKIMIFMTPGTTYSGSVEIAELKFTNTQETPPYTGNEYSGDKQDFSVNQKYVSNDPNKYTFEYQSGKAKAAVTKQPGDEWIYFYSPIKGTFSDFKYLNLTVKGSAGQQLMVKVQNPSDNTKNKELSVDLDGKERNIQWDISDVTYRDSLDKIMIFMTPGTTDSGSVEIAELKFTNTQETQPYTGNEYSGDKQDFSVNQKYVSNDPNKYTFEYQNGKAKAAVSKEPGDERIYFYSPIKGTFSDFKYLNLTVKGTAGQQLLVKVQNPTDDTKNKELYVNLDGKEQNIQWDISDVAYRDSLDKVMIFMTPGTTDSGSVEIAELKFTNTQETQPYTGNEYSGDKQDFSVNQKYVSNDPNKYTFEYQSGKVKAAVTKEPGDEWIYFYSPIKGTFSDFKYLNLTVKGTAGQQLLVKVQNPTDDTKNKELYVNLDGKEQNIQWDISDVAYRDSLDKIMIFMTPGTTDSSSVEIAELKFTNTQSDGNYYANTGWSASGCYSLNTDTREITVNKNNNPWDSMQIPIGSNVSEYEYLNIELSGEAGKIIKFKLADGWNPMTGNNADSEYDISISADAKTYSIPLRDTDGNKLANLDRLSQILVFAAPGDTGSVSFKFQIQNICFTKTRPAENIDLGVGAFRLLADKWNYTPIYWRNPNGTIGFNKNADGYDGIGYSVQLQRPFSKLVVKVKGDVVFPMIVKAYGGKEVQTDVMTGITTYVLDNISWNNVNEIVLMAYPGNQQGAGNMEIISMEFQ